MSNEVELRRRKLVPVWIKVFGWLFMLLGTSILLMPVLSVFVDPPFRFSILGIEHMGSPFDAKALLIQVIMLALGVSAYGLLFGKSWGHKACMLTGYAGLAICIGVVGYALLVLKTLHLRLEILVQIPYLVKLHALEPLWLQDEADEAMAVTS